MIYKIIEILIYVGIAMIFLGLTASILSEISKMRESLRHLSKKIDRLKNG